MVTTHDAIVGRDDELAAIDDFIAGAGAAVLLLEGEPGIGKTTLWREAAARAEARGARALRARPAESEAKLSYAALTDLLSEVYDDVRDRLPEPQQHALDAALLRGPGTTEARTVGSGLVSVLAALADLGPVLLAVDDTQWLDRASARALEFAARRLAANTKLLIARRPQTHPIAEPSRRIELGPLSLGALHHVLRANLGSVPARPTLLRIAETSGGNPFFALEIGRALQQTDDLAGPLPVPESLQGLVAGRLDALSAAARQAALVAAALSRPTVATVGASAAALEETEAAGVLVVERDRIRFSHPLLASAVYAGTSGSERLSLHRRLAEQVDDPEERALHLALSSIRPDREISLELEEAAARAARRGAQDAAADLYRAAERLTPTDEAEARARRLRGRAAALHAAGSPAEARLVAEQAAEVAPSGAERAEALHQLSQVAWVDRGELGPVEYLRLALDEAGEDRRLLGRVHAKLGMYSELDQPRAVKHAEAAVRLLDEDLDPGLLAYTLLTLLFFGAQIGRGIDERLLERALELERRAGPDDEKSSLVLIWYQCTDAHEAARDRHRLEDEWYRDRGEEIWRAEKRAHMALVEFRAGDWQLARLLIEQSCAEMESVGSEGPLGMPFWTRARFDAYGGRVDAAKATLESMLETAGQREGNAWFTTFLLEGLGAAALTAGDHAGADRAFTKLDELLESIGVTVPLAVRTDADHVEAVVALGDLDRARRLLARFEARARSAPRLWARQALPRARALVAAAEGDPGAALALLEESPLPEKLPFEDARNLLVQGVLQRRLKRKLAAAESLGRAVEIFERLGAPDWERRSREELARVGLRRGDRDTLTASEKRVAELAASGLTNRQVAQAAFMSPKTVEAYLGRVYRKLGIRSRAELGAAMGSRPQT